MFAENVGFIPGTDPLFLLPPAQLVRSPGKEVDLLQHDLVEFAGWAADRKAHILEGLFSQSQPALVDGQPGSGRERRWETAQTQVESGPRLPALD